MTSALGELGRLDEAREAAGDVLRQEPDFSIKAYTGGLSYRNPAYIERIAADATPNCSAAWRRR